MTSAPAPPTPLTKRGTAPPARSPGRRVLRKMMLVAAGIAIGALATRFIPGRTSTAAIASELGTAVRPGPWGELYTVPFHIAAPDELLPVRTIEAAGTHWVFKNSTRTELTNLLESAGLPTDQREAFLDPAVAHVGIMDIELTPTPAMVAALPEKAREVIYRGLAQFPENRPAFFFIHKDTLHDRFGDSGVSPDTLALFRKFCCEHGDYLVLGGLPALLSHIPGYEEKMRFAKALTRQKTMLIRLRVTDQSDPKTLAAYWARGRWAPSIRTVLEGIEHVPGSTFMSIMALLPPLPASQLYFYPDVQSAQPGTTAPVRDCHWTSQNFFSDPSDTKPMNPAAFAVELATSYFPISGDPSYGDVVILEKPDGEIVHSAVFIADEIVFTKNGSTPIFPWMFSTVPDLRRQYSFLAPEGRQLTLRYFRNKGA